MLCNLCQFANTHVLLYISFSFSDIYLSIYEAYGNNPNYQIYKVCGRN